MHTRAGVLAEGDGDLAGALRHHENAVERFPFNFRSGVALVRLYSGAGRVEDARGALRRLEAVEAPSHYLAEARRVPGVDR